MIGKSTEDYADPIAGVVHHAPRPGNHPTRHTRRGDGRTLKGSYNLKEGSIVLGLIFYGRAGEKLGPATGERSVDSAAGKRQGRFEDTEADIKLGTILSTKPSGFPTKGVSMFLFHRPLHGFPPAVPLFAFGGPPLPRVGAAAARPAESAPLSSGAAELFSRTQSPFGILGVPHP